MKGDFRKPFPLFWEERKSKDGGQYHELTLCAGGIIVLHAYTFKRRAMDGKSLWGFEINSKSFSATYGAESEARHAATQQILKTVYNLREKLCRDI